MPNPKVLFKCRFIFVALSVSSHSNGKWQDAAQASVLIQYYTSTQIPLRGHHVKFQFSNRKEVEIKDSPSSTVTVAGDGQPRVLLATGAYLSLSVAYFLT